MVVERGAELRARGLDRSGDLAAQIGPARVQFDGVTATSQVGEAVDHGRHAFCRRQIAEVTKGQAPPRPIVAAASGSIAKAFESKTNGWTAV